MARMSMDRIRYFYLGYDMRIQYSIMNMRSYFFTKRLVNPLIIFFILSNGSILIVNHISSGYSQAFNTNSPQNLSNNPGNSTDPQIALYQNNVYVIWTDDGTGNRDIYFKRSTDNGTTFGSIENLSNNPGNSTGPFIIVSQSNIFIVWTDDSNGNRDIYFKRSTDNGTTFGSINNISNNTGISSNPQIAAAGNNVHIVWTDTSSGSSEIYYRQSLDNQNSQASRHSVRQDQLMGNMPLSQRYMFQEIMFM